MDTQDKTSAMIAVIKTGGKQYTVKEGDVLKIEKIEGNVSDEITLGDILLRGNEDGSSLDIGAPLLAGMSAKATILEQGRGKKIAIIKYKPKVRYRRKNGHRQFFTKVQITKI